jgi:hypothetical protein
MKTVYVGNLDSDVTEKDLLDDFDRYGRINDIYISRSTGSHNSGYAFVEYLNDSGIYIYISIYCNYLIYLSYIYISNTTMLSSLSNIYLI